MCGSRPKVVQQDPEADVAAAAAKATAETNMKKAMRKGLSGGSMLSPGNEQKPLGGIAGLIDKKYPGLLRESKTKLGGG